MKGSKLESNYNRAVVMVHGLSEYCIARYIKSNLRITIEPYGERNGRKSIQITGLKTILNSSTFRTPISFLKKYEIETVKENGTKTLKNFKFFIVMDTDDCTSDEKEAFLNKSIFIGHWLYNYIVPITNITNLEDVMIKCGIKIEKKSEYMKIFPTNRSDSDVKQIQDLNNLLEKNKGITNMFLLTRYCLDLYNEKLATFNK
jgi:hypothetical protein